jgi:hypothetical protein
MKPASAGRDSARLLFSPAFAACDRIGDDGIMPARLALGVLNAAERSTVTGAGAPGRRSPQAARARWFASLTSGTCRSAATFRRGALPHGESVRTDSAHANDRYRGAISSPGFGEQPRPGDGRLARSQSSARRFQLGRLLGHALSCIAARGGRLHRPDDAQAEPRGADVRRRAAAVVGRRAAGSPRLQGPVCRVLRPGVALPQAGLPGCEVAASAGEMSPGGDGAR